MSAVVPFAASALDDIRGVAGFASLTLGLIGYLTNLRYSAFGEEQERIRSLRLRTLGEAAPDIALLFVALVALVAMAPLLDAFELDQVGRRAGALPTLFALIWLGFAVIAGFELRLIVVRFRTAIRLRRRARAARRRSEGVRPGEAANAGERAP